MSSSEVRELKKSLPALTALQKDYISLVEEEDADCGEAVAYYTELIDDLKKRVKSESMKYARMIVTNPHFSEALEIENGKLLHCSPETYRWNSNIKFTIRVRWVQQVSFKLRRGRYLFLFLFYMCNTSNSKSTTS